MSSKSYVKTPTKSTTKKGDIVVWDSTTGDLVADSGVSISGGVGGGVVPPSRRIDTTFPLQGGGDLSVDRTHIIATATGSSFGVVKPDGVTITISSGVLSAPGAGGGTVTNFSSGNLSPLFTTSVTNPTTTPVLNFFLSAAAGGSLFGNPTGSSAVPTYFGVNFPLGFSGGNLAIAIATTLTLGVVKPDGVTITIDGSGTISVVGGGSVTSVGLAAPLEFTVSGSPVTTSGTLTLTKANQTANTVWAGPTSGSAAQPAFRLIEIARHAFPA